MHSRGILLLLAALAGAGPLQAEEKQVGNGMAHLGGHLFVPNSLVPQPFVRTSVRNILGLGQALDVESSVAIIDSSKVIGFEGDILVANLAFDYQQAIKPWLGFHVEVGCVGRLGTEVQSLLAEGVTTAFAFRFGWWVPAWQDSNDCLAVSFAVANRSITSMSVREWAEGIVTGTDVPLVRTTPTLRSTAGLRYARGFNELMGLTAAADLGYGESVNRANEDDWFCSVGASFGFDLDARTSAPLYLALGYAYDSFADSRDPEHGTHASVLQVAYSGREDFTIGLELSGQSFPVAWKDPNLESITARISMQYFF